MMRLKALLANVLLLGLIAGGAGCSVVGTTIHSFYGDPPIHAQYVPPSVPTLVLVENLRSPGDVQLDADQIAQQVCEELKHHTKMEIIEPDKVAQLREVNPKKYHAMYVADIGRSVGAKQVIYIDLVESAVSADVTQTTVQALATARVRVVDIGSGETLWPASPPDGKELANKMDFDSTDRSRALSMHTEMLTQLSSQISKLFYTWKADNTDQENAGDRTSKIEDKR